VDGGTAVQEKFSTLSLAFKTDRQTLDQRLDVHLRARDVAENNIRKELAAVRDGLCVLGVYLSIL